jgi:hypothetical protein
VLLEVHLIHKAPNTIIDGFILAGGFNVTNSGMVVNNYFNYPTIDGTNTNICNLPSYWIYERNINQTVTTYFPLSYDHIQSDANGTTPYLKEDMVGDTVADGLVRISGKTLWSPYLKVVDNNNGTNNEICFRQEIDLTNNLPMNVKLIDVKVGFCTGASDTFTSNAFSLNLIQLIDNADIMDIFTVINGGTNQHGYVTASTITDSLSNTEKDDLGIATQYCNITESSIDEDIFRNNKEYGIVASVGFSFEKASTSATIYATPVAVTYRW